MKLVNEKTRSYLRIFFCMVLIIIWAIWIINAPTSKRSSQEELILETTQEKKEVEAVSQMLEAENQMLEKQNTKLETRNSKLETPMTVPKKVELPKLVDLQPKAQGKKLEVRSMNLEKQDPDTNSQVTGLMPQIPVVKLPEVAHATRKVLLQDNSDKDLESNKKEISLRKEIPINNSATQKSPAKGGSASGGKTEDKIETSWLPKYIIEKNALPNTIKNLTNNLDHIAGQIDFTGLIKSIQGPGAAIIRNNANNTIEILKIGEEYKGLQLLEINENEITLGNPELEKRYIKKLVTQIKDQ